MIKYFYLVFFEYILKNDIKSSFNLGVFSTKKKAKEKIQRTKNLVGFNQYDITHFQITKFRVDFDCEVKNKSNLILYCVEHEYEDELNSDIEYWNIFGYFSTFEKANSKVEYLRKHSRIGKKYPNNFEIVENMIDNFNSWSEGFVDMME